MTLLWVFARYGLNNARLAATVGLKLLSIYLYDKRIEGRSLCGREGHVERWWEL